MYKGVAFEADRMVKKHEARIKSLEDEREKLMCEIRDIYRAAYKHKYFSTVGPGVQNDNRCIEQIIQIAGRVALKDGRTT